MCCSVLFCSVLCACLCSKWTVSVSELYWQQPQHASKWQLKPLLTGCASTHFKLSAVLEVHPALRWPEAAMHDDAC